MTVNSIIGSLLVYSFLGLNMEAAICTLCAALGEFFYHTNIKTPQGVGYIFQRPEMQRIHHEYEKHTHKMELSFWWDILFGTNENSKEFNCACGLIQIKN